MLYSKALVHQGSNFVEDVRNFVLVFYSLSQLHLPSARHDGSFWHPGDKKRSTFNGKALPFTVFLLEVRGDCAMRKEVFQFPGWRDKQGCCHLCLCKPIEIRNFESCKAFDPLDHFTLLQSISNSGIDINELFQTPGLDKQTISFGLASHCGLGRGSRFYGQRFSQFNCLWKTLAWQQCQRKGEKFVPQNSKLLQD